MSSGDDDEATRQTAARKQTEELVAGFDVPARRPRPPIKREIVDVHPEDVPESEARSNDDGARRGLPTAVIAERRRAPVWVMWSAALVGMAIAGVLVAAALPAPTPAPKRPPTSLPAPPPPRPPSSTPAASPPLTASDSPPPSSAPSPAPASSAGKRERVDAAAPAPAADLIRTL